MLPPARCDYQVGRVVDAVEELGELDNTLVIYIMGDNGASAEGSPSVTVIVQVVVPIDGAVPESAPSGVMVNQPGTSWPANVNLLLERSETSLTMDA